MTDYSPIILEEFSDPPFEPTEDELRDYAKTIGFDLDKEPDLTHIAVDGMKASLPKNWKPILDKSGSVYFFNFESGEASWEHPLDQYQRGRVISERYTLVNAFQPPKLIKKDSYMPLKNNSHIFEPNNNIMDKESIFIECISEEDSGCSNGSCIKDNIVKKTSQAPAEPTLREENPVNHNSEVELITKFISVHPKAMINRGKTSTMKKIKFRSKNQNESDIDITRADVDEVKSDASMDLTISMNAEGKRNLDEPTVIKYIHQIKELNDKNAQLEGLLEERNQSIASLNAQLEALATEIKRKDAEIEMKDKEIEKLKSPKRDIEDPELRLDYSDDELYKELLKVRRRRTRTNPRNRKLYYSLDKDMKIPNLNNLEHETVIKEENDYYII